MSDRKRSAVRLNIRCSPEVHDRIESLMKRSGCEMSEVIRRSLAVYDLLLKNQQIGGRTMVEDSGGAGRELVLDPPEEQ